MVFPGKIKLSKLISMSVILILLCTLFSISLVYSAPIFSSDFEVGNFSQWTAATYSTGVAPPTVQSSIKYDGNYSGLFSLPDMVGKYSIARTSFSSQSIVHIRTYCRISNLPGAGDVLALFATCNSGWNYHMAAALITCDAEGNLKWGLRYYTDNVPVSASYSSAVSINANQWYCVEVREVHAASGAGEYRLWIDGDEVLTITGITNNRYLPYYLCLGGEHFAGSFATNVYHDCVVLDNQYIGVKDVAPVNALPWYYDNSLSHSSTLAGLPVAFSSNWADDSGLSHYIFSTNITGRWVNDTAVAFNSSSWANASKILPSSVGVVVGYQWFVNDTDNKWTPTPVRTLVTTSPTSSVLFSSGFEGGDTNEWNGVAGAPFIVTSPVHCGSYALGCDNSNEYVYKTISASELYFRAYVQFSAVPSLYETVIFYKMRDTTSGRDVATLGLTNVAGTIRWRLTYFDGSTSIVTSQQQTGAVIDTWYCVELRVKCSATNAEYQVWINGNELTDIAQTGRNSVSTAVNRVLLGETYEDLRAPFTVYSDCVVASDRYIGVETSNAAPICNYVGKSSSVAGSNCVFSSYWTDDSGLSQYIFSTNNTGKWKNDTALAFSSTPGWANAIKTLNTTIGSVIAYRWFAQDANGLWAATEIQTLTTVSQPEQRGVVSIVFDDNYRDQYDYAYPLMNIRGITGTFYVVTNQIGVSGRMTFQQLQTLQNSGNEIGSHSVSHPSSFTSLTAEQIHYQCSTSKQVLQDHGLFVNNFAYPDGLTNDAVDSIVSNYYRSGRTAYIEPYINDFSQAQFKRISAFNAENNSAELAELEAMVDQVYETDGWGVFFFHHIIPSDYHSQYTTSSQDFASFLDYVLSKGVQILTVNQALDLSQGNVDPSINVNIELPGTTLKYTFDIGATWTAPGQVVVGGQTLSFVRWSDGSTDLTKTFTASGSYTAIYESP